jgi:two-component system cell cycle sensor histidine kinase/response regulator CckA
MMPDTAMTGTTGRARNLLEWARTLLGARRRTPPVAAASAVAPQEDVLQAVSRLAGEMAHDLNNVLLVVRGYTELALGEPDTGAVTGGYLAEVRDAAARAAGIVDDLLVVGRRGAINPRLLDVNDTLARMLPDMRALAGAEVRFEPGPELPVVFADEEKIRRMAAALCAYARPILGGNGTLVVRTSVEKAGVTGPGSVRLSFTGSGTGAPAALDPRLFEPYLPEIEGEKSRGLELTIAHAIVKRFGGEIRAQSVPGGISFSVTLPGRDGGPEGRPIGAVPAAEALPAVSPSAAVPGGIPAAVPGGIPAAAPGGIPAAAPGGTILLAEDDAGLRDLATRILSREGFTVLAACDGQEAVDLFEQRGDAVCLVVLDDVMPRMGGRAALGRMRARRPDLPAILCSGYAWSLDRAPAPGGAGIEVLPKPWQPRELLSRVRSTLIEAT